MMSNAGRFRMRSAGRSPAVPFLFLLWLALLFGCGGGEYDLPGTKESVLERLDSKSGANDNAGLTSEQWLEGVSYAPVAKNLLGDVHPFSVENRSGRIERFPCSECHTLPLKQMKSSDTATKKAHWELGLHHASSDVMTCTTCHSENGMDSLSLLEGERVGFDQSYRICAQCHSSQAKDWIGGAHGKRLGGWAPPRVVASCASCHNPHDPAWKPRFPARASRVVEKSSSNDLRNQ